MQEAQQQTAEAPTPPAELVHVPAVSAPLATTSRAVQMRQYLAEETELRELVKQFIAMHMVEHTDFGTIPGTAKPTLLKPGAEKLVALFSVEPHFAVTGKVEQWDDPGLFHYEVTVELRERGTGIVRAVGMGSANSREGRYRWRNGERLCPSCGKATIIKGKAEYGGGFVCFTKKGGCGAKFRDDDSSIVDQQIGKVENDDVFTLVNTILKMAKKRALVDGALALARCSDIFTQDVEDLAESGHVNEEPPRRTQRATQSTKGNDKPKNNGKKLRPMFSKNARWEGSEQWASRPLDEAPLSVLSLYYEAYKAAHEACEDERVGLLLREHLTAIENEMAAKEPRAERDVPHPDPEADRDGEDFETDPGQP